MDAIGNAIGSNKHHQADMVWVEVLDFRLSTLTTSRSWASRGTGAPSAATLLVKFPILRFCLES